MRLLPNELSKYCEFNVFEEAERNYLFHCIECGICSYVCPAKRPMVQLLRFGKQELQAMRMES
jgi:electron transport complex protein RnfC